VCLTATSIKDKAFCADVMVQTLKITSLAGIEIGSLVNLELAAQLDARMGGHIVQGHVDGVATVVGLAPGEKWARFDITIPQELGKYIVNQGSIAVDGISLTVGEIDDTKNQVTLWLIPETLERTNLSTKKTGDLVNVEVDVLAKYVERLISKGAKK
jgi:riboflavin synthase